MSTFTNKPLSTVWMLTVLLAYIYMGGGGGDGGVIEEKIIILKKAFQRKFLEGRRVTSFQISFYEFSRGKKDWI